jgi:hypothetical protein
MKERPSYKFIWFELGVLLTLVALISLWAPTHSTAQQDSALHSVPQTPQDNRQLSRDQAQQSTVASARRIALVIGNGAYTNAPPLKNPPNDASDMAVTLKALGFDVASGINVNQRDMKRLIREFGQSLKAGGAGLFYYAGHGAQLNGRNYLVPTGAMIEKENDLEYEAVDAGLVLDEMFAAGNQLNIVILDACRNNPFARSFRSDSHGLAVMKAPVETVIAYATAPGEVANDGTSRNGLYTQELLKNIKTPGLKLEDVFKRVRTAVRQISNGKQIPWESVSLEGDFYFVAGQPSSPSVSVGVPTVNGPNTLDSRRKCGLDFIEATGEAELGQGVTKEQADQLAYEDALRSAIRKTCPMGVSSPMALLNNSLIVDLLQYAKRGIPVDTEILARETIADSVMRDGEKMTVDRRRVRIRTRFVALQGDDDPGFQVTISGLESSYVEGQEARVRITATRDCYVYLFTVAADQSVTVFFPNKYRPNNRLKAGQTIEFPDDNDGRKGIQFIMEMPQGQRSHTNEWITAIAVKRPVDFLSGTQIQEALEKTYTRNETGLLGSLLERLAQLRSGDVAQDVKEYEVLRKAPKD